MDRRLFLKSGLMAGTLMITGSSLYGCADITIIDSELIDDDVHLALTALLPVFLAGALPQNAESRQHKIGQTIAGIKVAMKRLPPHTLDELKDLFALLTNRLANLAYAGNFSRLEQLTLSQRSALIEGWRTSYIGLLNTAYEGLKELIYAAFYGNPDNWSSLDYHKPF